MWATNMSCETFVQGNKGANIDDALWDKGEVSIPRYVPMTLESNTELPSQLPLSQYSEYFLAPFPPAAGMIFLEYLSSPVTWHLLCIGYWEVSKF